MHHIPSHSSNGDLPTKHISISLLLYCLRVNLIIGEVYIDADDASKGYILKQIICIDFQLATYPRLRIYDNEVWLVVWQFYNWTSIKSPHTKKKELHQWQFPMMILGGWCCCWPLLNRMLLLCACPSTITLTTDNRAV